jgi:BatD DUF11 like domain
MRPTNIHGSILSLQIVVLLLCMTFRIGGHQQLSLDVLSQHNQALTQIQPGKPFIIEIGIPNGITSNNEPTISGIEPSSIQARSLRRSITHSHGVTHETKIYSYVVNIPHEGTFTIGPASLETKNGTLFSSTRTLQVCQSDERTSNNQNSTIFLTCTLPNSRPYIGQKVPYTLQFFVPSKESIQLQQLDFSEKAPHLIISPQYTTTMHSNRYQGQEYKVLEYKGYLHFKNSGECPVPPVRAVYARLINRFNIAGFASGNVIQEQIYCQNETINVQPLPPHSQPIQAVGSFSTFDVKINNLIVESGQALVLSLTLTGDGNFDLIEHPQLNLPDSFLYYTSKTTSTDTQKNFEYILQPTSQGTYEIAPQSFTYFDPILQQYTSLTTHSLSLTVTKGTVPDSIIPKAPHEPVQQLIIPNTKVLQTSQSEKSKSLWWWQFPPFGLIVLLAIIPLLALLNDCYKTTVQAYLAAYRRRRKIFKYAWNMLKQAEDKQDASQLYLIFNTLSELFHNNNDNIGLNCIENQLKSSDQHIWRSFSEQLYRAAFSSNKDSAQNQLYSEARQWLAHLQKIKPITRA